MEKADSPLELLNGNKRLRRIKVYQVKAGREILQEAYHEVLRILSSAIRADYLARVMSAKNDAAGSSTQTTDIDLVGGKRVPSPSGSVAGTDVKGNAEMTSEVVRKESSCSSRDVCTSDERPEPSQRADRSDHSDNQNRGVVPEATPIPSPRDAWGKRPRVRKDKLGGPKICLTEKKVKDGDRRLKRQQDLVRLKRAKRRQQQQQQQEQECVVMWQEDRRSGDMERDVR